MKNFLSDISNNEIIPDENFPDYGTQKEYNFPIVIPQQIFPLYCIFFYESTLYHQRKSAIRYLPGQGSCLPVNNEVWSDKKNSQIK